MKNYISSKLLFTSLTALFWGISIFLTKYVISLWENPFILLFWIIIIPSIFWFYKFYQQRKEIKKISKKSLWILFTIAIISWIIIPIIEIYALKIWSSLNYAFLTRTSLLFTILFAFIFLNESMNKKKWIIATLILIGCFFLITNWKKLDISLSDGISILQASLLAFWNTILWKIALKYMSPTISATMSFLMAFIPSILLSIYFSNWIHFPKFVFLTLLLWIASVLWTVFRFKAYQLASASYIAMMFSITPLLVTILGFFILHENLSLLQFIGWILIVTWWILVEKLKI